MRPQQKFELLSKKNLLIHDFCLHFIKNSASKNKIINSAYFEEYL